ncbi:protein amalgam-like isoform X2 [Bacillus rossius redtenbacheri]|uniref:protein amalgam-like isoform X2 n=1 Tax=Bacillus rossius redtenbacheri TaxID=93214 RepID=UPI002FDDD481
MLRPVACSQWLLVATLSSALLLPGATGDVNSLDLVTEEPAFLTSGRTFRIKTKDTVVLPCEVTNPGRYVLAWKRGIAVLTAGNVKVTPDARLRLVDGYNLEISDVQTGDAGFYVCQIGTLEPQEISHSVEVLVPPRIQQVSSNGVVEVKKGATVTLECRASGNPPPTITWTRKNNILPSGEQSVEGFTITIEQVNRHQAGVYVCSASNGVGEPASETIGLRVLYAPEIEVERSWIHSGEGYEAQLACIVHAEPAAEVVWYRDSLRVDPTERRILENRGSRRTLIIRKVQFSDFGNYSCVAENVLGKARNFLELSGKPNRAVFRSHPLGRYRDSYNITWSVDSYTPIEEFKLFYRRLPQTAPHHQPGLHASYSKWPQRRDNDTYPFVSYGMRGEWNDVILPAIPSELHTQQMSYLIKGLEAGAQFEAKVQAKNRFGWSLVSDGFQFSTRSAEPEVRDLSMTVFNSVSAHEASASLLLLAALLAS